MQRQRVSVVTDSRPIAAAMTQVLQLWGIGAEVCGSYLRDGESAPQDVPKPYDWMLVDLDNWHGITPYIHLASFDALPTILFVGSRLGSPCSEVTLKDGIPPVHSYLVNKYGNLLSQTFNISTEEFLSNHFCSLLQLPSLLQRLANPLRTGMPNAFRNVSRILTDFGMAEDVEVMGRLIYLDSDLCPDPKERERNRLKEFHAESSRLEKRMVADLITDNVRYLQGGEPARRVLWIEDRPDRAMQYVSQTSSTGETLRGSVSRCFSYYRNMSVFLLQRGFDQFFARLRQRLLTPDDPQGQDGELFHNLGLEQICGEPRDDGELGLEDFEAVLLDLHFEDEERISGKDLIVPLMEAAPETPVVVFSRSRDPEVIDGVLRSGGDFYVDKSFPSAVPVFINRCYDADTTNLFFIKKSKARLYLLDSRYDARIRIDTDEDLAKKAALGSLVEKGATLVAERHEERDEEADEFLFKMRNVLRWREVFIYTDEVEGLGSFVEFQGPDKQTVDRAIVHFGLDTEEQLETTYLQMYDELKCPRWLKSVRGFHERFGELVFGSTSGILTTMGALLGVYVAVKGFVSVMASVAVIAAADSFSDAYSMYSAKLAERGASRSEAIRHGLTTLAAKFFLPIFFMLALWLANRSCATLQNAVCVVLVLAVCLLATMSAERPLVAGEGVRGIAWEVSKNVFLAFVVLLCSGLAGYAVDLLFGA